jgi:serine O-acetyltransferase
MNFLDPTAGLDGAPVNPAANRLDRLAPPESPADRKAPAPARRPGLFGLIASDLRAKAEWNYGRVAFATLLKVVLTDGTAAMIWYRLMQWARRWRLAPLELLFNRINTFYCNCIIGRGAEFGPGFVLVHGTGVVINGEVRGGSNVRLEHQVTIGAERRQSPVLGDDVFVGAGAKVIGPVTIGTGARVGANAVVVKDVPPHATVVGIPARVVRTREPGPAVAGSLTTGAAG